VIAERLLAEEDDDPVLSLVNLIDVFLVVIAALLLAMASHPLNPFSADKLTVIRNAGQPDMQVVIKDGQHLQRFQAAEGSAGGAGSGGVKAGVAYRLPDGSMVYVPE
jgi:hypothetical protein